MVRQAMRSRARTVTRMGAGAVPMAAVPGSVPSHVGLRPTGSGACPTAAPDHGPLYRNLGRNYWEIRREWPAEDDYMSLPVLRPDARVA